MTKSAELASKKVKPTAGQRVPVDLNTFRSVYNNPKMQSAAQVATKLQEHVLNIKVSANWVRAYATRYSKIPGSDILKPADRFSPQGIVDTANKHRAA